VKWSVKLQFCLDPLHEATQPKVIVLVYNKLLGYGFRRGSISDAICDLDLTNPDDPVKEHKSKKEKKDEKMIIWKDVRKKKKERIKEKRIEKKLVYKTKAEYEQSDYIRGVEWKKK
jgi:hypothetical protein